jgi:hypothetical protein
MKKLFAALAVLTVVFGGLSLVPANASTSYQSTSNHYEGGANN